MSIETQKLAQIFHNKLSSNERITLIELSKLLFEEEHPQAKKFENAVVSYFVLSRDNNLIRWMRNFIEILCINPTATL